MKKRISALIIGASMAVVMVFTFMPREAQAISCSASGGWRDQGDAVAYHYSCSDGSSRWITIMK